jgi:hypothetical protein
MIQGKFRGMVLLEACSIADFATTQGAGNLLRKGLLVTELVEQGLVQQILDVLGVVEGSVGGRGLGSLLLVPGLTGVDSCESQFASVSRYVCSERRTNLTLENAKPTEIGQRDLKFAHGLGTSNIVFGLARGT